MSKLIEKALCQIAKAPVRWAVSILVVGRLLGGSLVALAEGWRWWDGIWYGVVTQTTTGYGDFFPESTLGRLFAEWTVMWPAVIAVAILTGAVAAAIFAYKYQTPHDDTPELGDDFAALRKAMNDEFDRLEAITSHPHVVMGLRKAHEERTPTRA